MKPLKWNELEIVELNNPYFNRAKWLAEKKAIRRERNTIEFDVSLHVAQTQYENWASGGDNTFSAKIISSFIHRYKRSRLEIETKLDGRYGANMIDNKTSKNDDRFSIKTVIGWQMTKTWSYAASGELQSQFATGYESRTNRKRKSAFMAPGKLNVSVGFRYVPSKIFSVVLSPVGGNAVFMFDDELSTQGLNGVPKGDKSYWTVGPSVRMDLDYKFWKDIIRIRSNMHAFWNLKKPPTVNWETTFDILAGKFLSTKLYFRVLYDKEADTPKADMLQLNYSISVGLTYKINSKKK